MNGSKETGRRGDKEQQQRARAMGEALEGWNANVDLEVFCYTPEEFERKKQDLGIVQQAVKEGRELQIACA